MPCRAVRERYCGHRLAGRQPPRWDKAYVTYALLPKSVR